jgi:hypothetical protein
MRSLPVLLCALILACMRPFSACAGRESLVDGGAVDAGDDVVEAAPGCMRTCGGSFVCCDAGLCTVQEGCTIDEDGDAGALSECVRCAVEDNAYVGCLILCCGDVGEVATDCIAACRSSCSSACGGCAKTVLDGSEQFCRSGLAC